MNTRNLVIAAAAGLLVASACAHLTKGVQTDPSARTQQGRSSFADESAANAKRMYDEGQKIFRHDTFGSEAFWGGKLQLHRAILGEKQGGVGGGLSPKAALQLGLKVDEGAMPAAAIQMVRKGSLDLDKPETTIPLLKANAIVGITGFFTDGKLTGIGIQCALCHSTVDDSLAPGIGRRLDGWPNRDLNVGAIVALAPNLKAYADLLGLPEPKLKEILLSWGPGRYDAEVNHDGKAFRPDGKSASVVMPAAFGLAGVNFHTYTGSWGNVTYWNAYVANTQMRGQGVFYDPRLKDAKQFPLAAKLGDDNIRNQNDQVTAKLAALQFYQLALPAPHPPANSYDQAAAQRGSDVFSKARCSTCHVPPLYTEPGYNLHDARDIGIDDFQASRTPSEKYRTTPLRGLFTRMKGGFYHDGRFADLAAVVEHYNEHFHLNLSARDKADLIEFLKSL